MNLIYTVRGRSTFEAVRQSRMAEAEKELLEDQVATLFATLEDIQDSIRSGSKVTLVYPDGTRITVGRVRERKPAAKPKINPQKT